MEDALKEKLTRVLNSPIETEERIVYFFVELRKLMEQTKTKRNFPLVNLYCNWVAHVRLTDSPIADEIVRLFDSGFERKDKPKFIAEINELITTDRLKKELTLCLQDFGLPAIDVTTLETWNRFRHSLAMVVTDCPLYVQARKNLPTKFIDCVTVSASVENDGTATIAWQVTRKGEQKPTTVGAFLILR